MAAPREITMGGGKFHEERFAGWDEGERRAMRDYLATLPDPADYAYHLRLPVAQALTTAQWGGPEGGWYVMPEQARILIPHGLCEAGRNLQRHYLGNFGFAVLRALRRDW